LVNTQQQYYEAYWTAEQVQSRGGQYRSEYGFLTPPLRDIYERYIPAGANCLDLGCGDGRTSGVWLTRNGRKYTGVDVSEEGVGLARSIGLDARTIEDAASLPFDSGTFDVVICIEVLEHLFTPHLAAKECARVVKPSGILLATTPNVAYWRRRLDMALFGRWHPDGDHLSVEQPWRDPHIRFFNPGALRRMLYQAGFRSVRIGGHEGSLIGDIPGVRCLRRLEPRSLYQQLESATPSLFAKRLHAIASK
jgi:2-polyprenyl-3-methyl-5-hydroxy-6-metoxy-1,4-benzoquinol methylase